MEDAPRHAGRAVRKASDSLREAVRALEGLWLRGDRKPPATQRRAAEKEVADRCRRLADAIAEEQRAGEPGHEETSDAREGE